MEQNIKIFALLKSSFTHFDMLLAVFVSTEHQTKIVFWSSLVALL